MQMHQAALDQASAGQPSDRHLLWTQRGHLSSYFSFTN
jgi:hypothetical protein